MCEKKNKLLFINIIIILVTVNINAKKVSLLELSAGDTININNLNLKSTEIYGDIFDGYNRTRFIEIDNYAGFEDISFSKKSCLDFESLISEYYPEINIDNTKFDTSGIFYNTNKTEYNFFGLNKNYMNRKYLYGIVKLCWIVEAQNLNIKLIDENDFPNINNGMNHKLLLDKTAILRFKKNNETHFVSSITSGDCIFQVRFHLLNLLKKKKITPTGFSISIY